MKSPLPSDDHHQILCAEVRSRLKRKGWRSSSIPISTHLSLIFIIPLAEQLCSSWQISQPLKTPFTSNDKTMLVRQQQKYNMMPIATCPRYAASIRLRDTAGQTGSQTLRQLRGRRSLSFWQMELHFPRSISVGSSY